MLALVLGRYLAYVGSPWGESEIQEAVERYIRESPRSVAEDGIESE
jgi:hypothetical protein